MKIVFTKLTEKGFEKKEFNVKTVRYAGWLVGMDIVDIGWRTMTEDDYDSFDVFEEDVCSE